MPSSEPSSAHSAAADDPSRRAGWKGTRVKDIRHRELRPGGRAGVTFFEAAQEGGRPHPRLRTSLPPATDPFEGSLWPADGATPPGTADAFADWLETAWAWALQGPVSDIDGELAPEGSERYYRNSIRVQRTARFFSEARALLSASVVEAEQEDARFRLRQLEDRAYAGRIDFDDADTGTYHSFGKDQPFVHYLETVLNSLPADGSEGMRRLPLEQQEAVRRQRQQARAHLDHLMRHKYAKDGIWEADIEQRLGGLLIDRRTRHVASETPESAADPVPRYELLRISPTGPHPHAGAWVHRAAGELRLPDGTPVQADADQLRRVPVSVDRLTFSRSTDPARLRSGVRFDWDGNGWLSTEKAGWVDWAGHCDIKAVLEQLGITLTGAESGVSVTEYRSDTGETTIFSRDLLLEMIASAMELGSLYARTDGSGVVRRGLTRFGGARNDSRPDRLQLAGAIEGRGLRWPLSQRADTLVVKSIEKDGRALDLNRAFHRWIPADEALDFAPNPLFIKTVEGDCSLLDVSGTRLVATVQEDAFDGQGYPIRRPLEVVLDLRPEAPEESRRVYLGAQLHDAAQRTLWKVWLDLSEGRVEAEVVEVLRDETGAWTEQKRAGADVVLPLRQPLTVTLSREMKRDDPAMFRTLLETALRTGQNICADTDMAAEVWNGVVTRLEARCEDIDRARRVEQWRVDLVARFGRASLSYRMRRDSTGEPEAWCPLPGESDTDAQPDFLWQDFPDVGSKGVVDGDWVVHKTMLDRGVISVVHRGDTMGQVYVHDDHIKNVYELLFCGLGGHNFTIVHGNKRWCFDQKADWQEHCKELDAWRAAQLGHAVDASGG